LYSRIKKITAVFTIVAFALSAPSGYAQQAASVTEAVSGISQASNLSSLRSSIAGQASPHISPELNPYLITIPSEAGKIDEIHQGKYDQPLVVHIQDVHANYEAQLNIKEIIGHLVKNHNFSLVQVEGATSKKLDPAVLKPSYLQEANLKLADLLLREGRITGVDAFAIETKEAVEFYGIEERALYEENIRLFRTIYSHQEEVNVFTSSVHKMIDRIGRKALTPALLDFTRKAEEFLTDKIDFLAYLTYLNDTSEANNLMSLRDVKNVVKYPNLVRILKIEEAEESVDWPTLKKEVEKLKFQFAAKFPERGDIEETLSKLDTTEKGVRPRAYFLELTRLGGEAKIDFVMYPQIRKLAEFQIYQDEVDHKLLFEELKSFENYLKGVLFTNEDQKSLLETISYVSLLEEYFRLEMSREKLALYLIDEAEIKPSRIENRLEQLAKTYSVNFYASGNVALLDSYMEELERYYRVVLTRDKIFMEALSDRVEARDPMKTILVTGGFHKDALLEEYRNADYSYVVVSPGVDVTQGSENYVKIMLDDSAGNGSVFAGSFATREPDVRNPGQEIRGIVQSGAGFLLTGDIAGGRQVKASDIKKLLQGNVDQSNESRGSALTINNLSVSPYRTEVDGEFVTRTGEKGPFKGWSNNDSARQFEMVATVTQTASKREVESHSMTYMPENEDEIDGLRNSEINASQLVLLGTLAPAPKSELRFGPTDQSTAQSFAGLPQRAELRNGLGAAIYHRMMVEQRTKEAKKLFDFLDEQLHEDYRNLNGSSQTNRLSLGKTLANKLTIPLNTFFLPEGVVFDVQEPPHGVVSARSVPESTEGEAELVFAGVTIATIISDGLSISSTDQLYAVVEYVHAELRDGEDTLMENARKPTQRALEAINNLRNITLQESSFRELAFNETEGSSFLLNSILEGNEEGIDVSAFYSLVSAKTRIDDFTSDYFSDIRELSGIIDGADFTSELSARTLGLVEERAGLIQGTGREFITNLFTARAALIEAAYIQSRAELRTQEVGQEVIGKSEEALSLLRQLAENYSFNDQNLPTSLQNVALDLAQVEVLIDDGQFTQVYTILSRLVKQVNAATVNRLDFGEINIASLLSKRPIPIVILEVSRTVETQLQIVHEGDGMEGYEFLESVAAIRTRIQTAVTILHSELRTVFAIALQNSNVAKIQSGKVNTFFTSLAAVEKEINSLLNVNATFSQVDRVETHFKSLMTDFLTNSDLAIQVLDAELERFPGRSPAVPEMPRNLNVEVGALFVLIDGLRYAAAELNQAPDIAPSFAAPHLSTRVRDIVLQKIVAPINSEANNTNENLQNQDAAEQLLTVASLILQDAIPQNDVANLLTHFATIEKLLLEGSARSALGITDSVLEGINEIRQELGVSQKSELRLDFGTSLNPKVEQLLKTFGDVQLPLNKLTQPTNANPLNESPRISPELEIPAADVKDTVLFDGDILLPQDLSAIRATPEAISSFVTLSRSAALSAAEQARRGEAVNPFELVSITGADLVINSSVSEVLVTSVSDEATVGIVKALFLDSYPASQAVTVLPINTDDTDTAEAELLSIASSLGGHPDTLAIVYGVNINEVAASVLGRDELRTNPALGRLVLVDGYRGIAFTTFEEVMKQLNSDIVDRRGSTFLNARLAKLPHLARTSPTELLNEFVSVVIPHHASQLSTAIGDRYPGVIRILKRDPRDLIASGVERVRAYSSFQVFSSVALRKLGVDALIRQLPGVFEQMQHHQFQISLSASVSALLTHLQQVYRALAQSA
jgi:hypothetical protein